MNNVIVQIASVGTGDEATYGMDSGSLQWSSASGLKTGIIDERSITGIAQAIDITKGGNLGGFSGSVSIIATSPELITAVVAGTITLIGKVVKIGVSFDGTTTPIPRFIGRVASWTAIDEITLEIVCDSQTNLDTKVIPSVTVTQEMALNVPGSDAIGKSVTTTYGNICDFPLIKIDSDKLFRAVLLNDNISTIVEGLAPKKNGGDAQLSTDLEYKGKSLCSLHGKYQSANDSFIWVALSFNGLELFGVGAEANLSLIKSVLVGSKLTCVIGNGKGESLKILNVEWATHDVGEVNLETIWIQVSSTNLDSFTMMGGYDDSGSNRVGKKLTLSGGFPAFPLRDLSTIAPYNDSELVKDLSFFEFTSGRTCFIVDSHCEIDDCKLVGESSSGESNQIDVPIDAITVLYESENWKMIFISMSSIVKDAGASFEFVKIQNIETRYYDPNPTAPNYIDSLNVDWVNFTGTGTDSSDYQGFVYPDQRLVPEAGDSIIFISDDSTGDGSSTNGMSNICLFVPIEGLINGDDISGSSSCFILPNYKIEMTSLAGTEGSQGGFFSAEISVYAISEGNQLIGYTQYQEGYERTTVAGNHIMSMEFDSTDGVVRFDNTMTSYDQNSYGLYEKIKSLLDVKSLIDIDTAKKIRGFIVKIYFNNILIHFPDKPRKLEVSKHIYPCKIGYAKSVSKDKLYLRSLRDGNLANTSCPAGLSASIALENGIDIYPDSFGEVLIKQRTLFDQDCADFDGQFQPTNETSVSDCLSEIAKSSMMAMYQKPDGLLYCKWFADDDQDTTSIYTFDGSNIVKGSMQISKPQGGYLYTDFVYGIKRGLIQPSESLYVNTDAENSTFPSDGVFSVSGIVYGSATNWSFTDIRHTSTNSKSISCYARTTDMSIDPMPLFIEGTKWKIIDNTDDVHIATLSTISIDWTCPTNNRGIGLAFTLDTASASSTIKSIQLYAPVADWRDYVSGSFATDHTIAKNIWDHAESARLKLGTESVMPKDTTTLNNPVWGSDSRALMQWILYTTIYSTRDKTVIRFTAPMTAFTSALAIMDYVEFAWGIYATTPTKGWIVETSDNLENQTIDFTILTSISDSDVLILNENYAMADQIIDERTTADENYNEGALV